MLFSSNKTTSKFAILLIGWSFFMSLVKADVQVVLPMSGRKFQVSGSSVPITVGWLDDQNFPLLDKNVKSYTISICSGPNSKIENIKTLASKISPSDVTLDGIIYKYDILIDSDIASSGVFFIQVFATGSFGYTIHYSNRFSISGLTGSIVASSAGAVTTPPSAQYSINTGTTTVASINSASFTIPYPQQSGISKFAPMQTQPGTSVSNPTAAWSYRYPTSAVTYYSTAVPASDRDCTTTLTAGWSYVITSDINYNSGTTKTGTGYDPKNKQTLTTQRLV